MTDQQIADVLRTAKTIAVVGLSSNPTRPSLGVSRFLQRHGYRIIPVNPNEQEVLGERAYASLAEVPDQVDIVNIFRRPARVPEVVEAAAARGSVKCIWMQEGVINAAAKQQAEAAGIPCVMDRCILKEMARLLS